MQLALDLLLNTTLLVSIGIVFNRYYQRMRHQEMFFKLLGGVILGLAGIVIMSISFQLPNKTIFDTRSILISISGLFYGAIPTSVAALIIIVYRIVLGGPGVYAGIAVTVTSAAIGIMIRHIRKEPERLSNFKIYCFGVGNHVVMLLCMLLLPKDIIWETLRSISIPVLTIYPLGTLVLSMIITHEWKSLATERKLTESEFQFQAVYDQAPLGIVVATSTKILYANSEAAKIFNMPVGEVIKVNWQSFTHPDDLDKELALFDRMLSGELNQYDIVKRYILDDGVVIWVHLYCKVFHRGLVAELTKFVVIIQDISKEVENEHRLKETSLFLTTLLDSIPDVVFYKNKEGLFVGCNASFEKASGFAENMLVGKNDYDICDPSMAQRYIESDIKALEGTTPVRTEETVYYPDGRKVSTETLRTRYLNAEGQVAGVIGISRDVTERKKELERIKYLNEHDIMSGLYNRMYFDAELDRIDSNQELPYSIISADIDSLKLTNDMFGHGKGDQLIIQAADILRKCCDKGIVARIGGDEFSILLPGVDHEEVKKSQSVSILNKKHKNMRILKLRRF